MQLQPEQPAQTVQDARTALPGLGGPVTAGRADQAELEAVLVQLVGELERGFTLLDRELRTRQYVAARESLLGLRVCVSLLDGVVPEVLARHHGGHAVTVCTACHERIAERGALTCWRCGG